MKTPPRRTYPAAVRGGQVDHYHGVAVSDPYRWLEDADSAETAAWVAAQNALTRDYLDRLPARGPIARLLRAVWNTEHYQLPAKVGSYYFFLRNDGLQDQDVLFCADALDGAPRRLLDPNARSSDGSITVSGVSFSPDGSLLAYAISESGSDWQEWRVRDVATSADLHDRVRWAKFSGAAWTHDRRGFFYSRYDEPAGGALEETNYCHKLYYHRPGTEQSADEIVYERPDHPDWGFYGRVSDDGRYLVIGVWQGAAPQGGVFVKDLNSDDGEVIELLNQFDAAYEFIDNDGPLFWFRTDLDAPNGRVIAVDLRSPDRRREVISETPDALQGVGLVGDTFFVVRLRDAHARVSLHALDGSLLRGLESPDLGTIEGFHGRRSERETFFSLTSFSCPPAIYRYDVLSGESRIWQAPRLNFDPGDFETRQVFFTSRDGTRVPMFISHRRGLQPDGAAPTYLTGYGGFGVSLTPGFAPGPLVWMLLGGVFAVANVRGGGEYGEEWHQAGTGLQKPNSIDDFITAAEWLVAAGYTRPARLAAGGNSSGALLAAAAITQRPDLFSALLLNVGVLDMLRFDQFTIGWAWTAEYGSPEDAEEFRALHAYSPLHNLTPGRCYPATLIGTADHDDRVVPAHSLKFAAAMQAAQGGPAPVLLRIETQAGHGQAQSSRAQIDEAADRWAFTARALGLDVENDSLHRRAE